MPDMILRVFQIPQPGEGRRIRGVLPRHGDSADEGQPGLASFHASGPWPGSDGSYCMVMLWCDEAAIRDFVGHDWQEAHVHPGEAGVVAHSSVAHFDLTES